MQTSERIRTQALKRERRSQLRALLLLGVAMLAFTILRAHPARIFNPGWWRFW